MRNDFLSSATCPYKLLLSWFHTPHPYEATGKDYEKFATNTEGENWRPDLIVMQKENVDLNLWRARPSP